MVHCVLPRWFAANCLCPILCNGRLVFCWLRMRLSEFGAHCQKPKDKSILWLFRCFSGRVTIRTTRPINGAGTPLRGAHELNVTRGFSLVITGFERGFTFYRFKIISAICYCWFVEGNFSGSASHAGAAPVLLRISAGVSASANIGSASCFINAL